MKLLFNSGSTNRRSNSTSHGARPPNSRRAIDLDATTIKVLTALREWQKTEHEAAGVESEGWVFTNPDGKPVPAFDLPTFERIANRAGVPRIRLHDLRHTHGTLFIKAGVPVKVASERLGHKNPAFTIDTYQPVLPGMQEEQAAGVR